MLRVSDVSLRMTDWAIAGSLGAVGQYEVWVHRQGQLSEALHGPAWANALAVAGVSLPLAVRRSRPLAVLVAVVACSGLWSLFAWNVDETGPFESWMAILIGLYSVGAYADGQATDRITAVVVAVLIGVDVSTIARGHGSAQMPVEWLFFLAVWGGGRALRRHSQLAAVLRERTVELEQEREERVRLAAAEERARIARELHDVITHNVTVMVVEASAERRALPAGETGEVLSSIERIGRQTLTELRRLLGVLRAPDDDAAMVPQPTLADVKSLIDMARASGRQVDLRIEGEPCELPSGVDLTAYRIVQEALTNVVKHAGAAGAEVVVSYRPTQLRLAIRDDGDTPAHRNGGGLGLIGMRERAAMCGGELQAGPRPEGGYEVAVSLPLRSN
jgi:signal transduction histidine kinase